MHSGAQFKFPALKSIVYEEEKSYVENAAVFTRQFLCFFPARTLHDFFRGVHRF